MSTSEVAEIPLTQGLVALVDAEDYDRVSRFSWCASKGYAVSRMGKSISPVQMSRFIMNLSDNREIDHANGNPLDNRKANLRICNRSQNNANRIRTNGTSGYRGVTRQSGKWKAQIKTLGRMKYLGRFESAEDAARAYDEAAREAFGEYARTNF